MTNRRTFLLTATAGLVAMAVIAGPLVAAELMGVITKVDVENKKVTVVEKDTDKEIEVTTNDDTEWVTPKNTRKLDLEKLSKNVEKAKEKNKKGLRVVVTHENGVASKIAVPAKKKDAGQ